MRRPKQKDPSFAADLKCANESYTGPGTSYNYLLSLSPGSHTLWTGLFIMVTIIELPPFA